MRCLLIGRGRMGRSFREAAAAQGHEIEGMLGRSDLDLLGRMGRTADILVDFSRPEALPEICAYARRTATPVLSGTTGCTSRELAQLRALGAHVPVLWNANYALGMAVLRRAAAGCHSVYFLGPGEELTLTHRADSREIFARGALRCGAVLVKKPPGFYTLENLLFGE